MKRKMIVIIMFVLCVGSVSVAAPMLYDLGTPTSTTESGWTHVDHTTAYSVGQEYGFATLPTGGSRDRTGTGIQNVWKDFVNINATSDFRIDLANGQYLVRLMGGDNLFTSFQGFRLSGDGGATETLIGRDGSTDAGDGITTGKARPFTFKFNGSSTVTADFARFTGNHDMFSVPTTDFLEGFDIPVTVTSGYMLISGFDNTQNSPLNFIAIEVVPEPATIGLLSLGGLALIRRKRK